MKIKAWNIVLLPLAALAVLLAVWGPEAFATYRDRLVLDEVHTQTVEHVGEGYRYTLSGNEKVFILSRSLNSQMLQENQGGFGAGPMTAGEYGELPGSYAFIVNHRGPSEKEITEQEIYGVCNEAIKSLQEQGVLPPQIREVEVDTYDTTLYSAIDILEPRNNVAVWKLSLSSSQQNADKKNRLIDAYIDADTGKIYEFYVRTPLQWEELNPDQVVEAWGGYMELGSPVLLTDEHPLMELTPYFKKYEFDGIGEEKTVVTIGFFEGINELFLRISQ